jgi:hypothetical protein
MKLSLGLLLALTMLCVNNAIALPPIPKHIKAALEGNADNKAFLATFDSQKSKCDVCHIPMADKKAKGHGLNDFGKAFHKHLDDKAFMTADKAKNNDEAVKLLVDAWTKTADDKNEAGETFGSLIKAGKMPGKNN